MSIFSKKKQIPDITEVPSDNTERRDAIDRSRRELGMIKAKGERVERVAESVQGHLERNHFIERLELSYGGKQRP